MTVAPQQQDGSSVAFLSFQSQTGDYIGQGKTRFDTWDTAAFSATLDASSRVLLITVLPADGSSWRLSLAAPIGQQLLPGTYEGATRYPFEVAAAPGLDFSGSGRGCNTSTGRFVVLDSAFGPSNTIVRFHATFTQHCEGGTPELDGEILLVAPFAPAPPPPPPPPPTPASLVAGNYFSLVSDAGDYIGGGTSRLITLGAYTFAPSASVDRNQLHVIMMRTSPYSSWSLDLSAPTGQVIQPGVYSAATRYPFQSPISPGLGVYGDSRGCNTLTGQFTVYEVSYGAATGTVDRLRATFEQHCEGIVPALHGDIQIVPAAPAVTTQPVAQSVTIGKTATFTAAASGQPTPSLRWQVSANGGATWTDLTNTSPYSGTLTGTLTVTTTTSLNGAEYRAVATNSAGSASSTAAALTVYGPTATPLSLSFGATKAGANGALVAVTAPQEVTVALVGPPTAWTASSTQSWLQITNGSGAADGRFTAGIVNPGNVIGGSAVLNATVTVTAANAPDAPIRIPVTLTVDQTGSSTAAPIGQVDTPAQSAPGIVGAIGVTGWVVDDVGVSDVKIYRNCLSFDDPASCQVIQGNNVVFVGNAAFVAGARPDVEAAFPTYPARNVAGWGYLLLTNMLPHVTGSLGYGGQGPLSLYVYATDLEGHVTLLGRTQNDHTPTAITMANDTIVKPFGAIDTPAQGGTVSGALANFGWVLTPDANTSADAADILMPTSGASMVVYIDGVGQGTVAYNQCRGNVGNPVPAGLYCDDDVANIFGNPTPKPTFTTRTANATLFRNLDAGRSAIGAFNINTTTLSNGMHSIAWGVTDTAGRSEGIGSRNFFVLNSGADAPVARDTTSLDAGVRALALAPVQSRGDATSLPPGVAMSARITGRVGFDLATPLEDVAADGQGLRRVQMPDLGRIELQLGGPIDAGYLLAGDALRDLPVGSHLDPATGTFTWAPAPGYLGTYHLAFVRDGEQIPIDVTIRPMAPAAAGESEIRMNVDLPIANSTASDPVTIAGWALDPQAWTGSGIDAIHVWAYRRDVPSVGPQFVGAADLHAARRGGGADAARRATYPKRCPLFLNCSMWRS